MKQSSAPTFEEFIASPYAEWEALARAGLTTTADETLLQARAREGINAKALYIDRPARVADGAWSRIVSADNVSAPRPFCGRIDAPLVSLASDQLRADADDGVTSVTIVLDAAARMGRKDIATVCCDGVSVWTATDLSEFLSLAARRDISVCIECGAGGLAIAAMLRALPESQARQVTLLRHDIFSDALTHGESSARFDELCDELASAYSLSAPLTCLKHSVAIDTRVIRESGGTIVQELAFALSATVYLLRALEQRGVPPQHLESRFELVSSVGSEIFLEIAKWRALRLLWASLWAPLRTERSTTRLTPIAPQLTGVSARWSRTKDDPHTNLLRIAASAMSCVIAGVNRLELHPFLLRGDKEENFARHLVPRLQQVIAHESWLGSVADPGGGSFYIEHLTEQLALTSWELFQQHERAGGLTALIDSAVLQTEVHAAAAQRITSFETAETLLVGLNKFRKSDSPERRDYHSHQELVAQRMAELPEPGPLSTRNLDQIIAAARAGASAADLVAPYRTAGGMSVPPLQSLCFQRVYNERSR